MTPTLPTTGSRRTRGRAARQQALRLTPLYVRHLLDGTLTTLEFPVAPQPEAGPWTGTHGHVSVNGVGPYPNIEAYLQDAMRGLRTAPVRYGTNLSIREPWAQPFLATADDTGCIYRADGPEFLPMARQRHQWGADAPWKSAVHMPAWASRLTLAVSKITGERVDAHLAHRAPLCAGHNWQRDWNATWEQAGYAWRDDLWIWRVAVRIITDARDPSVTR